MQHYCTLKTDTLYTTRRNHFSLLIDGRSTKRQLRLPAGRLELIKVTLNSFNNPPNSEPSQQTQHVPWTTSCTVVAVISLDLQMERSFDIMSDWMVNLTVHQTDEQFLSHLSSCCRLLAPNKSQHLYLLHTH